MNIIKQNGGSNTIIIVIILGVCCLVFIIGAIYYYMMNNSSTNNNQTTTTDTTTTSNNPTTSKPTTTSSKPTTTTNPTFNAFILNPNIGGGGDGSFPFNTQPRGNSNSVYNMLNGISLGTADSAGVESNTGTYNNNSTKNDAQFDVAINSWWSIGFNDTTYSKTNITMDVRAGSINALGGFNTTSDYRAKENIIKIEDNFLERLCAVPVYEYNLKDDYREEKLKHIGVLAHELQEQFPEFDSLVIGKKDEVDKDGKEIRQKVSTDINYILLKAIQEQNELIKDLQNQVTNLENKFNKN
jgi:hypothetical protein